MPVVERTFTQVLRDSGEVLREVEHQDVVVRRRDGADLMLVDLGRETTLRQSLTDAARIIAGIQGAPAAMIEAIAERLPDAIAWTSFLSLDERVAYLSEFATTAAACVDLGVMEPVAQLDREWRATAAIKADPALLAALTAPDTADDEHLVVPRPKV